jgi:UDP-xylose/UDP-N-acetylglucosamine transporter B4
MLIFALLVSALMGIFQEHIYAKYGKHPEEALFYSVNKTNNFFI